MLQLFPPGFCPDAVQQRPVPATMAPQLLLQHWALVVQVLVAESATQQRLAPAAPEWAEHPALPQHWLAAVHALVVADPDGIQQIVPVVPTLVLH